MKKTSSKNTTSIIVFVAVLGVAIWIRYNPDARSVIADFFAPFLGQIGNVTTPTLDTSADKMSKAELIEWNRVADV